MSVTNDRMASWYENRLVRSRKRARYLQKRGENIAYSHSHGCWIWRPCVTWKDEFHCPECGSSHFGTSGSYIHREEHPLTGHCHDQYRVGCKFSWLRKDDVLYFWHERNPVPNWIRKQPIPKVKQAA